MFRLCLDLNFGLTFRIQLPPPHDKGKGGEVRGLIKLENPFIILFESFCVSLLSCLYTTMTPSIDDGAKLTGLAALSQGTPLPGVPKFKNFETQREYMLNHMAGAFRVFARHGFVEGMAGHISMRDPENPDLFWTNP